FLKNNNELNVRNGTLGYLESINEKGDIRVRVTEVAGVRDVLFNVKDYPYIDHGYAATVHKAQGITVDKTYVLATKGFNQHLTYVSMTRHTEDAQMYYSKEDFRSYSHLETELSKQAVKENALDYTKAANEFIESRGMADICKDIALKFNKVYSEVKDKFKDIGLAVKENFDSKQIFANIEERMLFKKEMKKISKAFDCPVSRDIIAGEKLTYAGAHIIGKEEYVILYTEDLKAAKIMPYRDSCDIRYREQVEIIQNKEGHLIAHPTSEALWNRKLTDISSEYGKPVSLKLELGDTGRCRNVIDQGQSRYYVMEQYDKVTLLPSRECAIGLKVGDYIKIQETPRYDYLGDKKGTKLEACKDYEKHQQIEKSAEKEKVMEKFRGREIEF
ncbi:MAG: hypothetical protein WBJ81_00085, partial [Rickettsiales bacterium]